MGGNVRKDGLRCDLEAVKDAGFSGVHFFHISRGEAWPECPEQIPCMSEKWGEVVRFLGDECARLGLALTVQNCPGWSQSGGPWIDLDHCMRDIECVRADFSGGDIVKIPGVPEKFGDAASDWRDICVLAFPTPLGDEGGPRSYAAVCTVDARERVPPASVVTNGDERIYTFSEPTTIRSMTLPGLNDWNPDYVYHTPWLRVSLEAKTADGKAVALVRGDLAWRIVVLPNSETLQLAAMRRLGECSEARTSWSRRFPPTRRMLPPNRRLATSRARTSCGFTVRWTDMTAISSPQVRMDGAAR